MNTINKKQIKENKLLILIALFALCVVLWLFGYNVYQSNKIEQIKAENELLNKDKWIIDITQEIEVGRIELKKEDAKRKVYYEEIKQSENRSELIRKAVICNKEKRDRNDNDYQCETKSIIDVIIPKAEASESKWRVNSEGKSKHISELWGKTFEQVLQAHNLPTQPFIENEKKHWIKKELTVCIAWADSSLWKQLKSRNNIGNVGNNDRGQVVHYATIEWGIEAIYKVLNNRYLWHKQSVWSLSPWGGGNAPFYATSPENWNNNVLNCLNTILDSSINESFNFRI